MFYRIKAIGREHRRILLCSPKADTYFMIGQMFDIALEYHFIGYVIRPTVSFIEDNGITLTEIRKYVLYIIVRYCLRQFLFFEIGTYQ